MHHEATDAPAILANLAYTFISLFHAAHSVTK